MENLLKPMITCQPRWTQALVFWTKASGRIATVPMAARVWLREAAEKFRCKNGGIRSSNLFQSCIIHYYSVLLKGCGLERAEAPTNMISANVWLWTFSPTARKWRMFSCNLIWGYKLENHVTNCTSDEYDLPSGNQTWRAGKSPNWMEVLIARKITSKNGSFSTTPCLMTPEGNHWIVSNWSNH